MTEPEHRSTHTDDSEMTRFERNGQMRFTSAQAIASIGVVAVMLLLLGGGAIKSAAEQQEPGAEREILLALSGPAGEVADATPLAGIVGDATSGLSPDRDLEGGGFAAGDRAAVAAEVPPVTGDAISPAAIGEPIEKADLDTVLVTGDSLSTPLDNEIARSFAGTGVEVIADPYLATGISREDLVDWGEIATSQVAEDAPDAVVMFIGANEGYPMTVPGGGKVSCCSVEWVTEYANRARQMLDTYRQDGTGRVYWVSVPAARDPDRNKIAADLNVAVTAAAAPWRAQVDLIPTNPIFAPGGEYADAIDVDGSEQIVRESDGIHLNQLGSEVLAEVVVGHMQRDFNW